MLTPKSISTKLKERKKQMGACFTENRQRCSLPIEKVMALTGLSKEELFDIEHGLFQGPIDKVLSLYLFYEELADDSFKRINLFTGTKIVTDNVLEMALRRIKD